MQQSPYLGIIEGFYGRSWSFAERMGYTQFLKEQGYHFYIYAPKSDPYLRKSWQSDWPEEIFTELKKLVQHYQNLGVDFGIGLSPFELYKDYNQLAKKKLQNKIERLNDLGVDILCLLFDDMQGDLPALVETQVAITEDVLAQTTAKKVIMCPTYYSFTPLLEKLFGTMPKNYWQDLGKALPEEVDIFWTGEDICSSSYTESHIEEVIALFGRKPFLWDNYPVNDGATISKHLHLKAFENRPAVLSELTTGHAANPMNQPWLSRIPLYSLPQSYSLSDDYNSHLVLKQAVHHLCGEDFSKQLLMDIETFDTQGLDNISPNEAKRLIEKYASFTDRSEPYAKEIIDWLSGGYTFDSACLTG